MNIKEIFGLEKKLNFYEGDLKGNWAPSNVVDLYDVNVMFLCEGVSDFKDLTCSKYVINNAVHLFFDNSILESVLKEVKSKYGNKYVYYRARFSQFLEDVLWDSAEAIVVYGLPRLDNTIEYDYKIMDKEEVLKHKDSIEAFNGMFSFLGGYYKTKEECYDKLKDIEMYFLGNKVFLEREPDENGMFTLKPGDIIAVPADGLSGNIVPLFLNHGIQTMKREDGTEYKALKIFIDKDSAKKFVFLDKDSAKKNGGDDNIICRLPLHEIREKYNGPVVIEPHRNWWVEF